MTSRILRLKMPKDVFTLDDLSVEVPSQREEDPTNSKKENEKGENDG